MEEHVYTTRNGHTFSILYFPDHRTVEATEIQTSPAGNIRTGGKKIVLENVKSLADAEFLLEVKERRRRLNDLPIKSNWELMAFYIIEPFITEKNKKFKRTQIINDRTLKDALFFLEDVLQHKKYPEHPEETLQKTLQNMRDKKWISFLTNRGDYQLTESGYQILLQLKSFIRELREAMREPVVKQGPKSS